jgi:hypothetical protein
MGKLEEQVVGNESFAQKYGHRTITHTVELVLLPSLLAPVQVEAIADCV